MKKIILPLVLALLGFSATAVAKNNSQRSYNMQRGLEEVEKGDFKSALGFFKKEIADNPKNGEAYMSAALASLTLENLEDGMEDIEKAIKYTSSKDKLLKATSYTIRGEIYLILEDSVKAEEDFTLAIKTDQDYSEAYERRGNLFNALKRYDESDADYLKLKKINAASPDPYIGLGKNEHGRGNYENAAAYFDKAIKIDPANSDAYVARAVTRMAQKKYIDAADDLIRALSIDYNIKAHDLVNDFPKEEHDVLIAKFRSWMSKEPYESTWAYYVGQLYTLQRNFKEAEKAFKKGIESDENPIMNIALGDMYAENGEYEKALENYMWAKDADFYGTYSETIDNNMALAVEFLGDLDGALVIWDKILENIPDEFFPYYRKGYILNLQRKYDEALANFEMAVKMDPKAAYAYLSKGDGLKIKGDMTGAAECYRKVLELDTVPDANSCAMYAYVELGEYDKAKDFMQRVIDGEKDDPGVYYDAACVYSRIGEQDKAVDYLKTAIDKGYQRFYLIKYDDDLDNLKNNVEFKKIYDTHKDAIERVKKVDLSELGFSDEGEGSENSDETDSGIGLSSDLSAGDKKIVEIPYTPEGGCAIVKCSINELPLSFVFDTGASVVSISQLEANFMFKNGFLTRDDVVGSHRFVDANGDVSEGTVINLKNVEFGGVKLANVKASVVRNQKAPLLLGQSVLSRLGKIEIDNKNKKLVITTK